MGGESDFCNPELRAVIGLLSSGEAFIASFQVCRANAGLKVDLFNIPLVLSDGTCLNRDFHVN
jgi:hypothetical protein